MVRLLREHCADFGPTLAAEKLAERHQIQLAKETVRRIQVDADLWTELRKLAKALTLHYERRLYLLADTAANHHLTGKYIEIFQYPRPAH